VDREADADAHETKANANAQERQAKAEKTKAAVLAASRVQRGKEVRVALPPKAVSVSASLAATNELVSSHRISSLRSKLDCVPHPLNIHKMVMIPSAEGSGPAAGAQVRVRLF
jgi:hypothetical protein